MDAVWAFQRALKAALDAALAAESPSVPVYDHAPDGQPMPFVRIGEIEPDVVDTLDGAGRYLDLTVPLIAYTSSRGQKRAHEINGVVRAALRDARMTLEGGNALIYCHVQRQKVTYDDTDITYVGISILNARLKEA